MNLFFSASAGTGKTWQVTRLYSALTLGHPFDGLPENRPPVDPRRILLATFTDNAAAELRKRVTAGFLKAEQDALEQGHDDVAMRARTVLRRLPAARICTLHAFCAGLLQEHALELGLPIHLETLADDDRELLLDDVLSGEIIARLEQDPDFLRLCTGMSALGSSDQSVRAALRTLLEKAADRGLDVRTAESLLPPVRHTVDKADFIRIRSALADAPSLPSTAANALTALDACLPLFPDPEPFDCLPKFGQSKKWKPLSDELAQLKERFCTEQRYAIHIDLFRSFARCLAGAASAFAEEKARRGTVDFGDQLLFARDLLRRKPRGDSPFDWIIIDEVQDTSRIQCEIIEALWGPHSHLVLCGDPKQSIYAWRSADPRVMPDLENKMLLRPNPLRINLLKSYRSKDRLIEGVNALFSEVRGPAYEAEALEPTEEIGALTAPGEEGPCMEWLTPDSSENTPADEMAAVARRIRLLVDGGPAWRPRYGYDEQARRFIPGTPVHYRDILILLRRTTRQSLLEEALRAEGVPFTHGGKGRALFNQQEVRDLLLFLQAVSDPFNDIALAGFLRSPLGGIPDDTLVELSREGDTFSAAVLRQRFACSGLPAAERLARFREQIGLVPASQLARAIVRETAYDATLAKQPGGEQKLANLKKAIDWLRAAERGGTVLLPDVVRRFEQAVAHPPRSGAAEAMLPDPASNAVTVMTVHGAKGLTRRVCFIPDIGFGKPSEPGVALWSPEGLLEMNVKRVDGVPLKTPGRTDAAETDRAVRELEETNLFYVAMTRARDLTVLSCAKTDAPRGWLKQALPFLSNTASDLVCRRTFSEIPHLPIAVDPGTGWVESALPDPPNAVAGWIRRPATSYCETAAPAGEPHPESSGDAARFGTLAHAVLEELAATRWKGDIATITEALAEEIPLPKEQLAGFIARIEAARELIRHATADASRLLTEFPFVFRDGETILDGTVDLLAQFPDGTWMLFDYKFSAIPPERLLEQYTPQLHIYRRAVSALHPGQAVSAFLLAVPPDSPPVMRSLASP